MSNEELRNMSADELQSSLDDAREELMNLRFQQSTGELTDHTRIRFTKRQIGRIMTIIHEKESTLESESVS